MTLAFDVIAFDLDGTLVDSVPDIADALNRTLLRFGAEALPMERIRALVGHGAHQLLRDAFGLAVFQAPDGAYPTYLEEYGKAVCVGTQPYPGVETALRELVAEGATLAVCTNKPEGLSRALLAQLGWTDLFAAVVGGDTLAQRKPDPAPLRMAIAQAGGGRAVFVGDSRVDAQTAAAAGLPSVAVTFGYADAPVESFAENRIDGFTELIPLLRRLG